MERFIELMKEALMATDIPAYHHLPASSLRHLASAYDHIQKRGTANLAADAAIDEILQAWSTNPLLYSKEGAESLARAAAHLLWAIELVNRSLSLRGRGEETRLAASFSALGVLPFSAMPGRVPLTFRFVTE